jgi:predicted nucleic acid-binding protein
MRFVVDASVAVKWFFSDELSHDQSLEILNAIVLEPGAYLVPDLFHIELAAVIVRKTAFDEAFARKATETIYQLGISTIPTHGTLLTEAIRLACSFKLSLYDSLYLATAVFHQAIWLTADNEAVKRVSRNGKLGKHVALLAPGI